VSVERANRPRRSVRSEAASAFGLGIGFVGGGLVIYAIASELVSASRVLLLVFVALLLASGLEPLIGRLRGSLPIPRGGAILLVYGTFFVALVGLGLVVVPGMVNEMGQLLAALPRALEHARTIAAQSLPGVLSASAGALIDGVETALQPGTGPATGTVVAAGLTLVDVVVSAITVLTLMYFWLIERSHLQRFALSFVPSERRADTRDAWNHVEIRLGGWVRGQLILMATIGIATGLAYLVIGLPSAIGLGLFAAIAEAIPVVGPAIGAVPAILVAATLKPEALLPVLVAYVVIHVLEANVLVPRVMRNAVGVSPFLIILFLLIGGSIGGIVGALIAVPMAAVLVAILERMQDRDALVAQDSAASIATSVAEPEAKTEAVRK
jgi:predicted PurR-regulated permease PerM